MKLRVALVCVLAIVLVLGVVLALQPRGVDDAHSPSPSASASPTAVAGPSAERPVATVEGAADSANANDYLVPGFERPGVFFVSSSLNIRCGILIDEPATGAGLGRWGCYADTRTWEFARELPGDPCFEPPLPGCGAGIEAVGHFAPGPMLRARVDDSYASRWTLEDGDDGYAVRELAAGDSLTFAGVTCSAAENNVITCTDTVTGHGFTVSGLVNEIY